jgi:AraC-like DNA-binding protein
MENQLKKLMSGLVAYAVQRDIPAERLLDSSYVTIDELGDLTTPLSSKQVSDIWLNAVSLSHDKLFGLHFGESLQLAALGIVGEIIKTSETVGDALVTAAALTHLITDSIQLEVVKDDRSFSVLFQPVDPDWQHEPVTVQMMDVLMVFVIHELDGLMFRKLAPVAVSYARPLDNITEYARVLRCQPESNAGVNQIAFDIAYWNERIITSDYRHQKILMEQVSSWESHESKGQRLSDNISKFLLSNSYMAMISLEDIASNFNVSTRTLQRKLKEENTSFQELADEARKSLAVAYLKDGSYQVKEVSYMLGYNELSAFTRTFKRWTGLTPAAYQQNIAPGKQNITTSPSLSYPASSQTRIH